MRRDKIAGNQSVDVVDSHENEGTVCDHEEEFSLLDKSCQILAQSGVPMNVPTKKKECDECGKTGSKAHDEGKLYNRQKS